ncbi:MAG: quinone oxidoreductase [Pseudomonadota bacterium]
MARTVQIQAPGDADAMEIVDLPVGDPGPGEIRIRHEACGLNFIDIYQRSGVYPLPMPCPLGMEGAGVVEAVGEGVTHLAPGDRAAYASAPPGSYCEARVMKADQVCKLPDSIGFDTAAAMMLKGLTTQYLFRSTGRLTGGETVLFHAAAGGVGLIACQWARAMGVRLIGTAGSDEKCALAKAHGADECINYSTDDFVARVRDLTDGKGVDVVMDSVGKSTWDGSLDCLKPHGIMATFGNASGKPDPVDPQILAAKGSIYLIRPTLFAYINTRESCQERADDLFDMVGSGKVSIEIKQTYALDDIAQAHKDLEARKTTGATVIRP